MGSSHKACLSVIMVVTLAFIPHFASSEPWVSTGDERTRHHLHILADSGKLNIPVTTWPVMWSGIKLGLEEMKVEELNETELWSYRYLQHTLKRAMRSSETVIKLRGSENRSTALNNFHSDFREGSEALIASSYTGNRFTLKVQHSYADNPLSGSTSRYDGSYIAATWGNWVLGAGAIDRWWGPGWQGSMILGNNARPSPGLFIHRKDTGSHGSGNSWLGSWDINLFANDLNDERYIDDARLFGGRATLKPTTFLELGISRTRISGGKSELDDKPKNTMSAFDWRLGHTLFNLQAALYSQKATRETNNNAKNEKAELYGVEAGMLLFGVNSRFALERQNTRNGESSIFDHDFYRTGYRYYDRPLATSIDTNSYSNALLGDHYLSSGQQISWRLGNVQLNNDNIAFEAPGGHIYGAGEKHIDFAELVFKTPLATYLQLELGAQYLSKPLNFLEENISSGGYLQLNIEF